MDAAGVGVGADAVVGNSPGDPDGALVPLPFSNYLHDPGFILVTDGERFTGAAVSVFLNQVVDAGDCLTS